MSHKLLHLTGAANGGDKLAFRADHIAAIAQTPTGTQIWTIGNSVAYAAEPYEQVLRLWGEALSE